MKVINAGFPLHLISKSTFNKQNVVDDRIGGDAVPCTAFIFTNYRCSIIRKLTLLMVVCVLRLSGWPQSAGSWVCSILGNCKGIPSFLSFSTPLPCVLKCRLYFWNALTIFMRNWVVASCSLYLVHWNCAYALENLWEIC